jgi:hypothetical protein
MLAIRLDKGYEIMWGTRTLYIVGRGVRSPPFLTSKAQSPYGMHAGSRHER